MQEIKNPFAEARKRFGCNHPAEQLIRVLERVEKLEAVVSDMINKTQLAITEAEITVEPTVESKEIAEGIKEMAKGINDQLFKKPKKKKKKVK